jgi:hypothetical protein
MTKRHTKATLSIALAAFLAVLAPGAFAAKPVAEAKEISKMAKEADTPAEHAQVAKQYLLRAKALEAKADEIERDLRDQKNGPHNPMATKWPAMVNGARERQERVAMQTRRAAQESYRLAEHHSKLSGRSLDQISSASE